MDPIQRKIVPDTQAPTNDAAQVSGPSKKFDIGPAGATTGTGGTQNIGRPNFDRIAATLQDCRNRNMTRDQARSAVIEQETHHLFGKDATPELANAVSDAVASDPHLSQLFTRLYSSATGGK